MSEQRDLHKISHPVSCPPQLSFTVQITRVSWGIFGVRKRIRWQNISVSFARIVVIITNKKRTVTLLENTLVLNPYFQIYTVHVRQEDLGNPIMPF